MSSRTPNRPASHPSTPASGFAAPAPRSLRCGSGAAWRSQTVMHGSLVAGPRKNPDARPSTFSPPRFLHSPGVGATHRLKHVPSLVSVHVCPPQPSLEAPITELGTTAITVIQFSHLSYQERGDLSRKNHVLVELLWQWQARFHFGHRCYSYTGLETDSLKRLPEMLEV